MIRKVVGFLSRELRLNVAVIPHRDPQLNVDGGADQVSTSPLDNDEMHEEIALFDLREVRRAHYANLDSVFFTLNGITIPRALLARISSASLTKVPDTWLRIARQEWMGLVIERPDHTRDVAGSVANQTLWRRLNRVKDE